MSKYPTDRSDPYTDQQSGVLRNRLNITSQDGLDRAEAALAALRSNELLAKPIVGNFDLAHLQAIHRHLFKDIYAWAARLLRMRFGSGSNRVLLQTHR